MTIGAFSWSVGPGFSAQQVTNQAPGNEDSYQQFWSMSGPSLGGLDVSALNVDFAGVDVLSSFLELPDLATFLQFDLSAGRLRFGDGTDSVNFNFTEISAVIVPLPPAVWAGLAGLVLVVGVRRLGWLF